MYEESIYSSNHYHYDLLIIIKNAPFSINILEFVFVMMITILCIGITPSYSIGTFVYVSNGEDGNILIMKLDPKTGDMKFVESVAAGPNIKHMAISPDHRFLYTSIRSEPFSVITYLINSETGNLTQLSKELLPDNMAYISVDRTGRFLLSVSYNDAKIAVNPIGIQGFVQSDPVQLISTGPNPHSILVDPSNRFVYVPHLGNDQIKQFLFNESTGILTPNKPDAVYTEYSSGPRHFDFSPNNRFLYVSNEKSGMVYCYRIDGETGILTEIQRISAMPSNVNIGTSIISSGDDTKDKKIGDTIKPAIADIHITPDGKWLYVSERATNTITAFAVDRHFGNLTYIGNYITENTPRGINIDPRGNFVISAGEESGYLSVFSINKDTGELNFLNRYESGKDPNWIEIVEFN